MPMTFTDVETAAALKEAWLRLSQFMSVVASLTPEQQDATLARVQMVLPDGTAIGNLPPGGMPELVLKGPQLLDGIMQVRQHIIDRLHELGVVTPEEQPGPAQVAAVSSTPPREAVVAPDSPPEEAA
jgi:hypothetical protein